MSKKIPDSNLEGSMRAKVNGKSKKDSAIRPVPDTSSRVIAWAPKGTVMEVYYCPEKSPHYTNPEDYPFEEPSDKPIHRWWYVKVLEVPQELLPKYRRTIGKEGWISETGPADDKPDDFISYLDAIELADCAEPRASEFKARDWVKVTPEEGLNLREYPGRHCDKLLLDKGTELILGRKCQHLEGMKWWNVQVQDGDHKGKRGWVSEGVVDGETYLQWSRPR